MVLGIGMDIVTSLFRGIVALLDSIVYWFLIKTYDLLIDISSVNLFGDSALTDFGTRIYTILGVIMLFKLSFSIITYIIDPDKLSDSKNGFQSIVKNIIIMLVMIVAVPFVFKYAMALQYVVIEDNTIGRVITGRAGSTNKNAGENMAVAILSGFIRPDDSITECADIGLNPGANTACRDKLNSLSQGTNLGDTYYAAFAGEYKNEYQYLLDAAQSVAKAPNGKYAITYYMVLSTLVGGFTAYIFLLFCIEIAIRTIKLGFLELIAPIPIVTYMDNGGKDGVFKKWLKECTGTYISLFIRLAAIQFGIYIITTFIINTSPQICSWSFKGDTNVLTSNCKNTNFFVTIFLILGTLSFIQQLPKLIENITGLKLEGGFELNPMKRLSKVPLLGGAAAAGAGIVGAGAMATGRLGAGLVKGLGAGAIGAIKGDGFGSSFKSSMGADISRAGTRMKAGFTAAGGTIKSNWSGNGKYESANSKYSSMMHGKDATSMALGKQLYDKFADDVNKNDYAEKFTGLIRNKEMAKVAGNVKAAKDRRDSLQSAYEKLNNEFKNGKVSADVVDEARVKYAKASGDYDKINSEFSRLKSVHTKDAERYDAYMKYADAKEAQDKVSRMTTAEIKKLSDISETINTSSTTSSSATSQTVGNVNVSAPNSNGERTTDSGIILDADVVRRNSRSNSSNSNNSNQDKKVE